MSRNFKQEFEQEVGCELMDREIPVFYEAINPSSTKEQVQRASERLYDLLQARGVRVRDD